MKKTIILTIILFMTMTTVVGCGTKEPIHTNDLLYRETKEELDDVEAPSICVSLRFAQ